MIYEIKYEGTAYVEAENEQEAKEKWEDDDIITSTCKATSVSESSGMDAMESIGE